MGNRNKRKHEAYIKQAREIVSLFRMIENNSNSAEELNQQMDLVVEKYANICADRGIV